MNRFLFSVLFFIISLCAAAQTKTPIYGDTTIVTSRTGAGELVIENSTKDSTGSALFNIGKGRTKFKRILKKVNDTTYLVGGDTLRIRAAADISAVLDSFRQTLPIDTTGCPAELDPDFNQSPAAGISQTDIDAWNNGIGGAIGPAGPKGDKGDKGDTGNTGATGSQGPQGPAGSTGAQGPKGDTGNTGSAGAAGTKGQGFTFRGAWAASTAYVPYDVVTYSGQTYMSSTSFTSGTSFNSGNWNLWAAKGADGSLAIDDNNVGTATTFSSNKTEQLYIKKTKYSTDSTYTATAIAGKENTFSAISPGLYKSGGNLYNALTHPTGTQVTIYGGTAVGQYNKFQANNSGNYQGANDTTAAFFDGNGVLRNFTRTDGLYYGAGLNNWNGNLSFRRYGTELFNLNITASFYTGISVKSVATNQATLTLNAITGQTSHAFDLNSASGANGDRGYITTTGSWYVLDTFFLKKPIVSTTASDSILVKANDGSIKTYAPVSSLSGGGGSSGGEPVITPSNTNLRYWNGFKNFVPFSQDSIPDGTINKSTTVSSTVPTGQGKINYNTGYSQIPNTNGTRNVFPGLTTVGDGTVSRFLNLDNRTVGSVGGRANSFAAWYGQSNASQGWVANVEGSRGWPQSGFGTSGITDLDAFQNAPPVQNNFNFLQLEENVYRQYGLPALPQHTNIMQNMVLQYQAGNYTYGTAFTRNGTDWTTDSIWYSVAYATKTTVNNSAATYSIAGTVIYPVVLYTASSDATYTISIDGVSQGTFTATQTNLNYFSASAGASSANKNYVPYMHRFVVPPGLHTVSIQKTGGSSPLRLLSVCSNYNPKLSYLNGGSECYVIGAARMIAGTGNTSSGTGYAYWGTYNGGGQINDATVASYVAGLRSGITQLAQDGINVLFVDVTPDYDPNVSGAVQSDGLHPAGSQTGTVAYANSVLRQIAPAANKERQLLQSATLYSQHKAVTANYTATNTDYWIEATGTITITLPTAVGIEGKPFKIFNAGSGVITINFSSGQTANAATTATLNTQYKYADFSSDGTNYKITANN